MQKLECTEHCSFQCDHRMDCSLLGTLPRLIPAHCQKRLQWACEHHMDNQWTLNEEADKWQRKHFIFSKVNNSSWPSFKFFFSGWCIIFFWVEGWLFLSLSNFTYKVEEKNFYFRIRFSRGNYRTFCGFWIQVWIVWGEMNTRVSMSQCQCSITFVQSGIDQVLFWFCCYILKKKKLIAFRIENLL